MINEEKTFEEFGYMSIELSHGSHKGVWTICDKCGKERLLRFSSYRKLCKSCSMIGKYIGKNNPNYGKHHSEETKIKISKSKSGEKHPLFGKHRSDKTKQKISAANSGNKNPAWNPNITNKERERKRNYPEYKEWRKLVYKRDLYTCQICKDNKGGNLVAHHIEGYNHNKNLRLINSNGITLCNKCHNKFHKKYGWGNNTKKQFMEFIENYFYT